MTTPGRRLADTGDATAAAGAPAPAAGAPVRAAARPGARLTADGIAKHYGGLAAVDGVSLVASPGEVTALIGPNGAGKTTLFQCLTGTEQADAGRVRLGDTDLTGLSSDQRARRGLARTFQRLAVFGGMTVLDNLLVAAEQSTAWESGRRPSLLRDVLRLRHADGGAALARAEQVLERTGLASQRDRFVSELPAGTQRQVELARALCSAPRALLLDEPAGGLDDAETGRLQELLLALAAEGLTVLLVEHDVRLVLAVSSTIYVLATGRLIATGPPAQIAADEAVRAAYLGPAT
jgi:branched-chain amino acid transport system ATP-binding protein